MRRLSHAFALPFEERGSPNMAHARCGHNSLRDCTPFPNNRQRNNTDCYPLQDDRLNIEGVLRSVFEACIHRRQQDSSITQVSKNEFFLGGGAVGGQCERHTVSIHT